MVRKEQVFLKKGKKCERKRERIKTKLQKADRFCKWEKTDAFRATKVKQVKAHAYSIALGKNPNPPSTLCFF